MSSKLTNDSEDATSPNERAASHSVDQSLSMLRSTLEASGSGILVVDTQGRTLTTNQRFATMWRIPPDLLDVSRRQEVNAWLMGQLVDPRAFAARLDDIQAHPDSESFDVVQFKDGRVLEQYSQPQRLNGRVVGRVYSFQDVSARVIAERVIQNRLWTEATLRRAAALLAREELPDYDTVLAMIAETADVDHVFLFFDRRDDRSWDHAYEWFAPDTDRQRLRLSGVDGEHLPWVKARLAARDDLVIPDVTRMPPEADAERALFERRGVQALLSVPILGKEQQLLGVLGMDVTRAARRWNSEDVRLLRAVARMMGTEFERRSMLAKLQASERRYAQVLEVTTNGIWDWDITTDRVTFSDRWGEMLGYTGDEVMAHTTEWMSLVHPDDAESAVRAFKDHLSGRSPSWVSEQRLRHRSGEWRWIQTRGQVVERDAQGRALRAVGTHTDVSDRYHLEAQLRQAQKMEAIGRLAGGVAHDFNNLLTAVMGHAELLLRRLPEGDRCRINADEVRKAAERAAALTSQLLAFSRQQIMKPRVVDVNDEIRDTESMLRRIVGEEVDFTTMLVDATSDMRGNALATAGTSVLVDPGQLNQVLLNLVVNARDAMPEGGQVTLQTSVCDLQAPVVTHTGAVPPGEYVLISVSDNGHGIDAATMALIFEPFFTTKELGKGTGLGLATSYGIVKQAGGHIEVASKVGIGTTFRIYLPRVHASPELHAAQQDVIVAAGGGERILLVEDDVSVRDLVVDVLRNCGYVMVVAVSPTAALTLAATEVPCDLILADVVMPGMNGRELTDWLCAQWPKARVIFMSGDTEDTMGERGVPEATMRVIRKPFKPCEMATLVRAVLDGVVPESALETAVAS